MNWQWAIFFGFLAVLAIIGGIGGYRRGKRNRSK